MRRSVLGLGNYKLEDMIACQTEQAAPESGAGDPAAKSWDWNSQYWRGLGAPWGGGHSSAEDVAKFLAEFLWKRGHAVKPSTATLMTANHNPTGLTPRGLGFAVGMGAGSPGCSELTFGHTGSTGTICWADPKQETVCVVLTSLPGRAMTPHPRQLAADRVAMAFGPA
jgi:CubicO group peptidase (beta-lactamase class C family)